MNYLLRTTNTSRRYRSNLIRLGLIIALLAIFAFASPLRSVLAPVATRILEPIFAAANVVKDKVTFLFGFTQPKSSLIKENEALKNKQKENELKLLDYERLKKENEDLLKLKERHQTDNSLVVRVLRVPDFSPYDTLLLDAGSNEGVVVGSLVFAIPEVPIGEVEYVYPSLSRVKLFSSPGEEHLISLGKEKVISRATGLGGGNFEAVLPRGVPISIGDAVVLPDISQNVFAVVENVTETEGGTFTRVLFKNPVSFSNLQFVVLEAKKSI